MNPATIAAGCAFSRFAAKMPEVPTRVGSPVLVGCEEQAAELAAALAAAERGEPSVLVLGGEAGIGKTRLIREFGAGARAGGARVLVGHCVELSVGELPFAPVAGALRQLVADVGVGQVARLAGRGRTQLSALVPEIAIPDSSRVASRPAGPDTQGQLFARLLALLAAVAAETPLVLVLEDLHWSDASTRDALGFLARNLSDERLLVVVTYRIDDLHRTHPVRPFLAELERAPGVRRMALDPLRPEDVADQMRAILGAEPDADLVRRVNDRAAGNPFFVEELLAMLAADEAGRLPPTVRDALILRADALGADAQAVLRAAAVAGRSVPHGILSATAGLEGPALLAALREAAAHQLLLPEAEGRSYTFRHALLQEAIYSDVLPGERVAIHMAVAEALETRDGSAAELAHHWTAAHDLARALPAAVRAGDEAERSFAFAAAQTSFEQALELWDRVPDAERLTGTDRAAVAERAANAAHLCGSRARTEAGALWPTASGSRPRTLASSRA